MFAALLPACATPGGGRATPEWVLQPPPPSNAYEYFVASATDNDAGGDPAAAEEAAGYSLLAQINQALGVDIDVRTSAEARSTLDSYEATLVQQVTQSGGGRVEGLRIADRFVLSQEGRVTVYILGEYERLAFEAERARRQAILTQQEDLILGPERQADQFSRDGRLADALQLYGQAAAAAAASDLQLAPVALERALQKAVTTASALRMVALGGPASTDVGVAPAKPVLFAISGDRGPVPGAPVEISYVQQSGGRPVVRSVVLSSDGAGTVSFAHPAPGQVGEIVVTARLATGHLLPLFDGLPVTYKSPVDSVKSALASVRATYRFTATSRAREVATTVVVADVDIAGSPMAVDSTSAGIIQALSAAGFRLRSTALESRSLLQRSDAQIIEYLQAGLPAEVQRAIFGVAQVVDLYEDDGYVVKVRATVVAVNLADGSILYSTTGVKNARSRTAERAISTALLELGIGLGEELAASLP